MGKALYFAKTYGYITNLDRISKYHLQIINQFKKMQTSIQKQQIACKIWPIIIIIWLNYHNMANNYYNMANNYCDKRSQRKYIKLLREGIEGIEDRFEGIKITCSLPILFCRSQVHKLTKCIFFLNTRFDESVRATYG